MRTITRLALLALCAASLAAHPGHGVEGHLPLHGMELVVLALVAIGGLWLLWRRGRTHRG